MAIPYANSIDLLKNEIMNAVFQNLATAPASPKEGQFYYNTQDKKMYYYNGTVWLDSTYLLPVASATVLRRSKSRNWASYRLCWCLISYSEQM